MGNAKSILLRFNSIDIIKRTFHNELLFSPLVEGFSVGSKSNNIFKMQRMGVHLPKEDQGVTPDPSHM